MSLFLLNHYQLGPLERGRMLYNCTSLGDRTPTAMLQHMRTMQPGEQEDVLFLYIFVNLLPDVVREVVSSMESLDEMAERATMVYQANSTCLVNSVFYDGPPTALVNAVSSSSRRPPRPPGQSGQSSGRCRGLCCCHDCYGRDAFQCDRPAMCPMRNNTCAPPAGNTPAGRD